jgi:glycosyltransferase involved in cell wall biosynthesis
MAIYLDVSAAVHRRAGLGRYAESLSRALVASTPGRADQCRYALFYNQERGIEPLAGLEHLPTQTVALGYKPWRMLVWLGQLAHVGFDPLLPDAELFHATEHLLLPLRSVPNVLTVHDLIFRHLPEHHKPLNRWYLNLALPLYCRRADHIIAVSEHSKRDLVSAYGVAEEKVTVVYEAADPRFRPQPTQAVVSARARYGLPERYVLFVGTIEPRKNLSRLLAAFEAVCADGLTDGLVIVGKRGWLYGDFFARLEESPVRDRVILPGYVQDEDLSAFYAGAQASILPSVYEGFGLPVLEALGCGTPLVTSNTSSLPELLGDAGFAVDPDDVQGLAGAILSCLVDQPLVSELRRRGPEQAARFTWAQTAQQTLAAYNEAAARRG